MTCFIVLKMHGLHTLRSDETDERFNLNLKDNNLLILINNLHPVGTVS